MLSRRERNKCSNRTKIKFELRWTDGYFKKNVTGIGPPLSLVYGSRHNLVEYESCISAKIRSKSCRD